ncbi:MAG TPA: TonB-dependent receptor [Opitutaceae bacterium]|nr:TonB-dependent receptor [Opitutaceae bacterium]
MPSLCFTLPLRSPRWAAALFALTSSTWAQRAPSTESEKTDTSGEAISLSAFTVSAENDKGWMTTQSAVGTRTAKNVMEIPAAVNIMNREMIMDLNATEASQVLKYAAPGVASNATYTDDVNIRGFRSGGAMRDGANRRSFKTNPMYDVERIEVLKGPSAMLLGSNDFLGGAVNFITRKPTEKLSGSVEVTLGQEGFVRGNANVAGPAYRDDEFTLLYRVTVGGAQGGTEKEIETIDQKFIGAGLLMYFGEDKRMSLSYNFYRYVDNDYRYLNDFLDPASPRVAELHPLSPTFSPSRSKHAVFDAKDVQNNLEFLAKLTSGTNLRLFASRADGRSYARFIRGITLRPDGFTLDRQDIPLNLLDINDAFQVDVLHRYEGKFFSNDFTVGADYTRRRNVQDQVILNPGSLDIRSPNYAIEDTSVSPTFTYSSGSDSVSESLSYYFQESVKLWQERIMIGGGIRWFDTRSHGTNKITSVRTITRNDRFPTHKYGILFRPYPWISVYYTEAENLYPQSGFTNAEPPVPRKDQEGALEEFGLKLNRRFSERFTLFGSAAVFKLMQTHVLTPNPQNLTNSRGEIINVQSERDLSDGWEADLGARVDFAGSFADILVTYYKADTQRALDKGAIAAAPNHVVSLLAKYTLTRGSLKGLMVGAGVFDRGQHWNGNAYTINPPPIISIFGRYTITPHWNVQVNVDNLTDETYVAQAIASGLASRGRPREIFLQTNYTW